MKQLRMDLGSSSYDIIIEEGVLEKAEKYIKEVYKNKKIYIITDANVFPLYCEKLVESLPSYSVKAFVINPGEESKSIMTYLDLMRQLIAANIRRDELLIALGGGVVGDLTGFIAATLYRGIPYVQIPTSLLSQMDSSIGGKTGIDYAGRKNIIGAFKQPERVLIDPLTIDTLPKEEIRSGMGELIKHGCIGNVKLLEELEKSDAITEDIIALSLSVKKELVELDPFDRKERMYLNFGHTFGHIIEMKEHLRHGEAVAKGMLMALQLGIDLGVTEEYTYKALESILKRYGFDVSVPNYRPLLRDTIYDKKNLAGKLRFIFIKDFGEVFMQEFNEEDLESEHQN